MNKSDKHIEKARENRKESRGFYDDECIYLLESSIEQYEKAIEELKKKYADEHGWLLHANTQIKQYEKDYISRKKVKGYIDIITGILISDWSDPVKLKGVEDIIKDLIQEVQESK